MSSVHSSVLTDRKNRATLGRERLQYWRKLRPENHFLADSQLQETLQFYLGSEAYQANFERWSEFGKHSAQIIEDELARIERAKSYPTLQRFSGIGERQEKIEFDPGYHTIGEKVYRSRILSDYATPGQEAAQLGIQYLLCHTGEAGHACPLACGAGMIKMLQFFASKELQQRFLPRLLDSEYSSNFQASQFLTEVQGGSDVGANAVIAKPCDDSSYQIYGEKWFCSVANADCFLMTARVENEAGESLDGTSGLGAFLVPRKLEDGQTNRFFIRRLKDKLGTRHMASAEIDFDGAIAYPLGPTEDAFKNVVSVVLTTSRVFNAMSCCGMMRRAEIEAMNYAEAREAFGRSIRQFPLIQQSLANIRCEVSANLASTLCVAKMADNYVLGQLSESQKQAFRMLVPMNKLLTAIRTTEIVHEAMEILAGNGAIEEFSVLPRLYRDAYVLEAWEGTHNVLAAQLARDIAKYKIHEGWLKWCQEILDRAGSVDHDLSSRLQRELSDKLTMTLKQLAAPTTNPASASIAIRHWAERAMVVSQALCLLDQSFWAQAKDSETLTLLAQFMDKHRVGCDTDSILLNDEQLARIRLLSGAS